MILNVNDPKVIEYATSKGITPEAAVQVLTNDIGNDGTEYQKFLNEGGDYGIAPAATNVENLGNDGGLGDYGTIISPEGVTTDISKSAYDVMDNQALATSGYTKDTGSLGLGNYGTIYSPDGVGTNVSEDAYNAMDSTAIKDSGYTKNKIGGSSTSGLGDITAGQWGQLGIGAVGLGANVYFANENLKLQKDRDSYLKSRDDRSDARVAQAQANYDTSRGPK